MASAVTSSLSKLNPFKRGKEDNDEKGEALDIDSVGGGGHAARKSKITKDQLVSRTTAFPIGLADVFHRKSAKHCELSLRMKASYLSATLV